MRNLNQFIGEFRQGFQQPNRFRLFVFIPSKMLTQNFNLQNLWQDLDLKTAIPLAAQWLARGVLVEGTRLPSRAVETIQHRMYGITEDIAYNSENTTLDCSLMMPLALGDSIVPRVMSYWQNMIHHMKNGPEDGADMSFPSDYYGSALLALFDRQGMPTLVYKYDKIYPGTVESAQLSWAGNDTFISLPVHFKYSSFRVLPRTSTEALAIAGAGIIGQ